MGYGWWLRNILVCSHVDRWSQIVFAWYHWHWLKLPNSLGMATQTRKVPSRAQSRYCSWSCSRSETIRCLGQGFWAIASGHASEWIILWYLDLLCVFYHLKKTHVTGFRILDRQENPEIPEFGPSFWCNWQYLAISTYHWKGKSRGPSKKKFWIFCGRPWVSCGFPQPARVWWETDWEVRTEGIEMVQRLSSEHEASSCKMLQAAGRFWMCLASLKLGQLG
jgi:hypothetical protein